MKYKMLEMKYRNSCTKGFLFTLFTLVNLLSAYGQVSMSQNYIMANTVKQSGITTEGAVNTLSIATQGKVQTISYMDGLGRPLQTVITQGSATQKDIIIPNEYDVYGREVKKYLPYADVNAGPNGSFRSGWNAAQAAFYNGQLIDVIPDAAAFSLAIPEASPLNRILAQGHEGTTWQPNPSNPYDATTHSTQIQYLVNKAEDSVRLFYVDSAGNVSSPGFYPAGTIYEKVTADEQGQQEKEFTDLSGHVVLKRVMITGDSLQTYYLFDNREMLRVVVQPEGVVTLKQNAWNFSTPNFQRRWLFLYRYDLRNRMVMKKVPGADSVLMFYDQWDRLVLTQDSNLRAQNLYLFTKYDQLNRPVVTGQITDSRGAAVVRAAVLASTTRFETVSTTATEGYTLNASFPSSTSYTLTVYTTTHYDNYNNLPSWSSTYSFVNEYSIATQNNFLMGQPIATQTKILGTSSYMRSVSYFDDKYRLTQVTADNADGGLDRMTKILSFDGKVTNDYQNHTSRFFTTPLLIQQVYSYDPSDRLLQVTHQTGTQEIVTLIQNTYNEVGQLYTKMLHQSPSHPNYLQKLDYVYTIRGWLYGINRPASFEPGYDESDLFSEELHYDQYNQATTTPQYNGNIAESGWKGGYDETIKGYSYAYDKANRLNAAVYASGTVSGTTINYTQTSKYNEQNFQYDHNGNLKSLSRYHGNFTVVDSLNYANYDGNKLGTITDQSASTSPVGFQDKNNGTNNDYGYDANGNLLSDYNKSITSIQYNFLNLPTLVTIAGKGTVAYTYDAAGNKLQKTITDQTQTPNKITNYYYAGNFVYRNDTLEFISHAEGRLRPQRIDTTKAISIANLKYIYDYFMKDHLGSVRSVLTTEQETDLYAATMEAANATKENALFANISSTTVTKPGGFDSDNTNGQVSGLNGNIAVNSNHRTGPAIVIKVMAGDTVSISTYAWYTGATQAPPSGLSSIATDLLPLLFNGIVADGGTHGGSVLPTTINGNASTDLTNFLGSQSYDNSRPKAYLNWMVVDEEFNAVTSPNHMGSVQVPLITGSAIKQQLIGPANMVVRRNGYLYVYVSNESNQFVYFDNLTIQHRRGPVVEQHDYYAFGLEIPGLSTQANKYQYNPDRYKYNGKELQANEFSDGSGLTWDDYGARMYEPEIGRWMRIDPLADINRGWTPFNYAKNNPIRFVDPDGMEWKDSEKDGKIAQRLQDKIHDRLGQENKNLSKAQAKVDKINKEIREKGSTDKLQKQLKSANDDVANENETINALHQSSINLDFMGSSETEQQFTFNETEGSEGHTYMQDGVITMDVVSDANAVHESTHGMQMFKGAIIGLGGRDHNVFVGGAEGLFKSEVEAYKNQFAFDPSKVNALPSYLGRANNISDINKLWLLGVQSANGEYTYGQALLGAAYNKRALEGWLRDNK